MYNHLTYGLGMGSWHVGCAWSMSHDGHRQDMGYVTLWESRGDHLALMSHNGCGYLVQSLGQDGRSLGTNYSWNMGWALIVSLYRY